MMLVVSPHLDDAVFSLGRMLASTEGVHVLTIFGGTPGGVSISDYDRGCGYMSASEALKARREENTHAMTILGCDHTELAFIDNQYRKSSKGLTRAIAEAIGEVVAKLKPDVVLLPVGIHHPDHLLVSEARSFPRPDGCELGWYEELPYRVIWPEQTMHRIKFISSQSPVQIASGPRDVKEMAVECYASQLSEDIRDCLYVPERIWRTA